MQRPIRYDGSDGDPWNNPLRAEEKATIRSFVATNFEKLVSTVASTIGIVQEGGKFWYRPTPGFKGDEVDRAYIVDSITRATMYGHITGTELHQALAA